MKAYVEIRSQSPKGAWPKQGPDKYVVVQIVPEGVEPLRALRASLAEKRGIKLIQCGEGYRQHTGPRSALGQALLKARQIAERVNAGEDVSEVS